MSRTSWSVVVAAAAACLLAGCLTPSGGAIKVRLEPVEAGERPIRASTLTNIVPMPALPGAGSVLVLTERKGLARWIDLDSGASGTLLDLRPLGSYPELGLLGFALHPDFAENRRVVTYNTEQKTKDGGGPWAVISEWTMSGDTPSDWSLTDRKEIFRLVQPQEGHNAGCLAFGPDGYLYIAFGDGGFQRDPQNLVQDTENYYGSILRIDVDRADEGKAYGIPDDNPFAAGGHLPEVWAWGFRNPWRFTFGPHGRLIVADVGQNAWEEINVVEAGGNYGWSLREGPDCFAPRRERAGSCDEEGLLDPVHYYGRAEGAAIIGGPVYVGSLVPGLEGSFVFGDNVSGRLWALQLPAPGAEGEAQVISLGGTLLPITTIGLDPSGEVVIGTNDGNTYRIVAR